jgi:hypothetical protein
VEGKFSSSKYVSSVQRVKRENPKPTEQVYIEIPFQIESLGRNQGHQTLRRTGIGRTQQRPVHQILPRVLHIQSSTVISPNTGRSSAFHRAHHTRCPMRSSKLPELENAHRTRQTQHHRTRHRVLCSPALLPRTMSAGTRH